MSILPWIIVGMIAGWLTEIVVPEDGPGGILGHLIVGVVGAFAGGWIFYSFGNPLGHPPGGSIVGAFIGAVMFLWILRVLTRRWARVQA